MSITSVRPVEAVEEGRIGILRGPPKLVSVVNGFRDRGSTMRFIVERYHCRQTRPRKSMRIGLSKFQEVEHISR